MNFYSSFSIKMDTIGFDILILETPAITLAGYPSVFPTEFK